MKATNLATGRHRTPLAYRTVYLKIAENTMGNMVKKNHLNRRRSEGADWKTFIYACLLFFDINYPKQDAFTHRKAPIDGLLSGKQVVCTKF